MIAIRLLLACLALVTCSEEKTGGGVEHGAGHGAGHGAAGHDAPHRAGAGRLDKSLEQLPTQQAIQYNRPLIRLLQEPGHY